MKTSKYKCYNGRIIVEIIGTLCDSEDKCKKKQNKGNDSQIINHSINI